MMRCNKIDAASFADGLNKIPVLRYQKDPVMVLNELYTRYPDGGEYGWYAFVMSEGTFAWWDIDTKRWKFISLHDAVGVRKVYENYNAMTADLYPVDDETQEPLKFGQMVAVTDDTSNQKNGIYRFTQPGWQFVRDLADINTFLKKNSGLVYKGIADPTTFPAVEDYSVFYMATENGFYVNFGNYNLRGNKVVMFENSSGTFLPYVLFDGETVKDVLFGGSIDPSYNLLEVTEPTWFFVTQGNYYTHDGVLVATAATSILTFNGQIWAIQRMESEIQFTNDFFDTL